MSYPTLSAGNPATERPHVLALWNPDGWLEVYGPRGTQATILKIPFTGTVEGERLALEYVEMIMSPAAKAVFWADCLIASDLLRPLLPSEIAIAKSNRELLATLREIETEGAKR